MILIFSDSFQFRFGLLLWIVLSWVSHYANFILRFLSVSFNVFPIAISLVFFVFFYRPWIFPHSFTSYCNTLAIRQKGESQNVYYNKTKHTKFCEERPFLTPWYAHVRVRIRVKKYLFFEKVGVLCFLVTLVLRFGLLPHYRRTALCFLIKTNAFKEKATA